jgi:4-aminobutyrate aminotransferase-like enzyme
MHARWDQLCSSSDGHKKTDHGLGRWGKWGGGGGPEDKTPSTVRSHKTIPSSALQFPLLQLHSAASTMSTHVLHRSLHEPPHLAVSSSGLKIHLSSARSVIDAAGGASVAVLGHTQPSVIAAMASQMENISYVYSGGYTNAASEELATLLLADTPEGGLKRALWVCSGSEAMEAALKMARQYHCERGETERSWFVSRKNSYHGNTLVYPPPFPHASDRRC